MQWYRVSDSEHMMLYSFATGAALLHQCEQRLSSIHLSYAAGCLQWSMLSQTPAGRSMMTILANLSCLETLCW